MIMGKYKKDLVKELREKKHSLFAASLRWEGSLDDDRKTRLEQHVKLVDIPEEPAPSPHHHPELHTRIHKETLQGYYLQKFFDNSPHRFVIIGFHDPGQEDSAWGMEQFCSALIFKQKRGDALTNVRGSFYQAVEANDLKNVKFYIKKPEQGRLD
jgi:hypothetical protein